MCVGVLCVVVCMIWCVTMCIFPSPYVHMLVYLVEIETPPYIGKEEGKFNNLENRRSLFKQGHVTVGHPCLAVCACAKAGV